ncbi:MAG: SurA N-terminal domain-containing protein [Desulfobacteraceae bacterium]|nr:SurA N-terminal domain-containing protein [Desulfobacteraceae bacterium]
MLQFIRNRASGWIVKFILSLIIVVFIFFGWGTYKSGKMNQIASVNGEVITPGEYRSAYNYILGSIKERFGGNLSPELIEMFQVEKQALNRLIQEKIILQKAREHNLMVSDKELADYIFSREYFLTDGKFDEKKYRQILNANRMSVEEFEMNVRKDLLAGRMSSLVTGAVKVTEKELEAYYDYSNKTADIKYASFVPSEYDDKNITVSDEEISTYYNENKENFKSEETIKVSFLRFAADDFKKDISVSDKEISSYYQENIKNYSTPEKVKARHILIRVEQGADENTVEEKRKQIEEIRQKIISGSSFEDMARQYSQGPSAPQGGDLGEFEKQDMVKPFSDAAFSLDEGKVSEPVRTQFGWHLVKVEKKTPASVKKLDDVKNLIENFLLTRKAKMAAYDSADAVYASTLGGASLDEEASARGMRLEKTDYFTRKGPGAGIADAEEFAREAFSYEVGETSRILELGENMYILQVTDRKLPEVLPLETVKSEIKAKLLAVKKDEKAKEDAGAFLAKALEEKSFDKGKDAVPVKVKETKGVVRQGVVKDLGSLPELQAKIFETAAKKESICDSVVKTSKGYFVFSVLNTSLPSRESFNSEKEDLKEKMLQRKKNEFFTKWIEDCRKNSEIKISPKFSG